MRLPEDIAARASWLRSGDFADRVKTQECLVLTEAAKEIFESREFRIRCYRPDNHGHLAHGPHLCSDGPTDQK